MPGFDARCSHISPGGGSRPLVPRFRCPTAFGAAVPASQLRSSMSVSRRRPRDHGRDCRPQSLRAGPAKQTRSTAVRSPCPRSGRVSVWRCRRSQFHRVALRHPRGLYRENRPSNTTRVEHRLTAASCDSSVPSRRSRSRMVNVLLQNNKCHSTVIVTEEATHRPPETLWNNAPTWTRGTHSR